MHHFRDMADYWSNCRARQGVLVFNDINVALPKLWERWVKHLSKFFKVSLGPNLWYIFGWGRALRGPGEQSWSNWARHRKSKTSTGIADDWPEKTAKSPSLLTDPIPHDRCHPRDKHRLTKHDRIECDWLVLCWARNIDSNTSSSLPLILKKVKSANHTCLYSPAAKRRRLLAGTHCIYPRRDGQAELTWVAGCIPR